MQLITSVWAFKIRYSLEPRAPWFENQIDLSFEQFLKLHFKDEVSHIWNRIQAQVKVMANNQTETFQILEFFLIFYASVSVLWY